jgi:soluble P-type ATPase
LRKNSSEGRNRVILITIPGKGDYTIEHLILDLNGTISLDGRIIEGVRDRLEKLSQKLDITVVTADTNKNAARVLGDLPVTICTIKESGENDQKLGVVLEKGKDGTVSMGNGHNDVSMLRESRLGICVLGGEGASPEAMAVSNLVVPTINDALDLLLKPHRLRASLRR